MKGSVSIKTKMDKDVSLFLLFNSNHIELDSLFDLCISDNPNWLEKYPQLKLEYLIVDGKIEKIDYSEVTIDDFSNLKGMTDDKLDYIQYLINKSQGVKTGKIKGR